MPTESQIVVDYVSPDRRGGQGNQKVPIASYTLALLSAQTPPTIAGCRVVRRVHDEQASGPYRPETAQPDILCLTYLTTGALRAYDLSDQARRTTSHAGAPIVVIHGGVHATSLPLEALLHAQFVVRGEIGPASQAALLEKAWQMRTDPSLKGTFRMAETTKTIRRPLADWSWMDPKRNLLPFPTTQTSAGCPFRCEFCSVTQVFGAAMRTIDRDDIYRQLCQFKAGSIIPVIDDNFLQGVQPSHVNHCISVAVMMRDLGLSWVTEVTIRTIIEAEAKIRRGDHSYALPKGKSLVEFFAEHGCRGFFFGIEQIGETKDSLTLKKSRPQSETVELIRRCQNNGIAVLGAFVLGVGPEETPDYAKRLLEFAVEKARLDFAQFSINTPMPGAQNFLTGLRDGTIFDFNWELYDAEHCVISHSIMKPEELESVHNWLCREFYAHKSIISRYRPTGLIEPGLWKRWPIGIGANLALHGNHRGWNNRLANSVRPPVVPHPHPTVLAQVEESLNGRGAVDLFNITRPDGISEVLPAG